MQIKEAINAVVGGKDLTEEQAHRVMLTVMTGEATPAQIASLLTALRLKGETVEEITGFARAMRELAEPVEGVGSCVDTCGTGGDGRNTFNISTTSAFVVAGAGVNVAKHGNRSVSSRCGSADVLQALGVRVDIAPAQVVECLRQVGMAFFFAPSFHKAMRFAAGPRQEMGIRTVFNILGPLTNPARATSQVVGVYNPDLTEVLAKVLGRLGSRQAYVVHGCDGLDEVSIAAPTRISHLDAGGKVNTFELYPESLGLTTSPLEKILGGTSDENARTARHVLQGERGPCRDVVLLNAALALAVAEAADDLAGGLALAAKSIDSGAARDKLEQLISFTQECAG